MTTEVASVIIMVVACATIIYFVRQSIKTVNDENIDIFYHYTFKFLVEYSKPYGEIMNLYTNVNIIDKCYSKALKRAIPELFEKISEVSRDYNYVVNSAWLIDTYQEVVK